MTWLKKSWGWLAAFVGVVLSLALWWFFYRRKLGAAQDALAVSEARSELAVLRARREEVAVQVDVKDEQIAAIDVLIAEEKRRIINLHAGGSHVSDAELDRAFADLGY